MLRKSCLIFFSVIITTVIMKKYILAQFYYWVDILNIFYNIQKQTNLYYINTARSTSCASILNNRNSILYYSGKYIVYSYASFVKKNHIIYFNLIANICKYKPVYILLFIVKYSLNLYMNSNILINMRWNIRFKITNGFNILMNTIFGIISKYFIINRFQSSLF